MYIVIRESCAGADFSVSAGDVVDLPEALAHELIRAGHAEPAADEEAAPPRRRVRREQAVVAPPENAAADPSETATILPLERTAD